MRKKYHGTQNAEVGTQQIQIQKILGETVTNLQNKNNQHNQQTIIHNKIINKNKTDKKKTNQIKMHKIIANKKSQRIIQ